MEGIFPSDKVVTLGNYQLQYVTAKKPPTKPAAGTDAHAEAGEHEHAAADSGKLGALRGPLTYMAGTIIVLLFLNLLAVLFRKRTPAPSAAPRPAPRADSTTHATTK